MNRAFIGAALVLLSWTTSARADLCDSVKDTVTTAGINAHHQPADLARLFRALRNAVGN